MNVRRRYALDANVFIQARQAHYGFDICPGFWRALIQQHEGRRVFSIDKVKSELLAGRDELSAWANDTAPVTFFKKTADQEVIRAFGAMVNWVDGEGQFTAGAKAEFARVADGWVVAYAQVNGHVVVTHEEHSPEARRRVPIPNVCVQFGVAYCNTFEMLRDLGVQFILRKRKTAK
jgi:hypothetical protein